MGAVALLAGKYGFPPNPLSGVPSAKAGMRALPPIGAADLGAEVDELPNSPPGISKSKGDEKDKKKRNKKKKKKVQAKDVGGARLLQTHSRVHTGPSRSADHNAHWTGRRFADAAQSGEEGQRVPLEASAQG